MAVAFSVFLNLRFQNRDKKTTGKQKLFINRFYFSREFESKYAKLSGRGWLKLCGRG